MTSLPWVTQGVGYALVVSGLADLFVTRLKRSGRMIGYEASTLSWIMPAGASYNDGSLERRIGSTSNSDDPARAPDGGGDAAQAQGRQEAIDRRYADRSAAFAATDGMRSWQKNMNQLRLRAGKRNIVNTYVWDADGGLRSEAQQFASTIEHSIGSVMDTEVKGGLQVDVFTLGVGVELTVQKTISWPTSPPGSES